MTPETTAHEKIMALGELETKNRKKLASGLREVQKKKLWQERGHKSIRDYMETELKLDAAFTREMLIEIGEILTSDKVVSDKPSVQRRIDFLKNWRREKAKAEGLSPYLVLTNRTLLNIAMENPRTIDDLMEIGGIGEKKMKTFGKELLNKLARV
jgi:ATP-dependent DNA helicase RecQ